MDLHPAFDVTTLGRRNALRTARTLSQVRLQVPERDRRVYDETIAALTAHARRPWALTVRAKAMWARMVAATPTTGEFPVHG
jgi:hypothetical protein